MSRFTIGLTSVALMGLGPALAASAANDFVPIDASHADSYEAFNGVTNIDFQSYQDGNTNRVRTYLNDEGGGSQIGIKFTGIDAALAAGGYTKADVVGATLDLTVNGFDQEFGIFEWKLYSVNDGVTNEDFDTIGQFDAGPGGPATTLIEWPGSPGLGPTIGFPGLDGPTAVPGAGFNMTALANPASTVEQGSLALTLDNTIDPTFDPRPQPGDVMTFTLTDLDFIVNDTNDALVLAFHQTSGFNGSFRPSWRSFASDTPPVLTLEVVPEPSAMALLGAGGLLALRRRRA